MSSGRKRILLFAAKTGYQVREFGSAARKLGVELVLATDRCHMLDDPWADQASAVDFANPRLGIEALVRRGPFDGILAVGDEPASVAAQAAEALRLRFHPAAAALAAKNKLHARERFRTAGLPVPAFQSFSLEADPAAFASGLRYPCVLKPVDLSASRGVIRANNPQEFMEAFERVRAIVKQARTTPQALVEEFIPGREFALEGLVTGGRLIPLALFDKPDPLDGPFFEETIYVAPSRQPAQVQDAIRTAVQRAVDALGLSDGPVHAEMRVNRAGVWMLEAAARPIGGLCSRVLRLQLPQHSLGLEELLLRHAVGEEVAKVRLAPGGHAVMMIPISQAGVYQGVEGVERARSVDGISDIVITAETGQRLEPLPEGASYLGFIFALTSSPETAEIALRQGYDYLRFSFSATLPVIR